MYAELKRKVCKQCKEEKSLNYFRKRLKRSRVSFESYCKACETINAKVWFKNNKDKMRSIDFKRNCEKFGIPSERYTEMAATQNNKCAICNKFETSKRSGVTKRLAIDHCHKTGKVRSLLCQSCNTAIGLLNEDTAVLELAIQYLKKFKN